MNEALYDVFYAFTLGLRMANGLDVSLRVETGIRYTLSYDIKLTDAFGQSILNKRGKQIISTVDLLVLDLNTYPHLLPELISTDLRGPRDLINGPDHLQELLYAYRPFILTCVEEGVCL